MTRPLQQFIDDLESRRRRIVVVNGSAVGDEVDAIVDYFDRLDVEVERLNAAGLPDAFLLLTDGDACLGAVGVAALHDYLFASITGDAFRRGDDGAWNGPTVESFLARLDQNVYSLSGAGKRPLTCVAHLLESRAWRRDAGRLHAGVQSFSAFREDASTWTRYRKLAEGEVETAVYGRPDWTPPDWGPIAAYADEAGDRIADFRFVIYQGADARDDGALLARDVPDGGYTGFWTFESDTVDALADTLAAESDRSLVRLDE